MSTKEALSYIDKSIDNVIELDPELPWKNREVIELLFEIRDELQTDVSSFKAPEFKQPRPYQELSDRQLKKAYKKLFQKVQYYIDIRCELISDVPRKEMQKIVDELDARKARS